MLWGTEQATFPLCPPRLLPLGNVGKAVCHLPCPSHEDCFLVRGFIIQSLSQFLLAHCPAGFALTPQPAQPPHQEAHLGKCRRFSTLRNGEGNACFDPTPTIPPSSDTLCPPVYLLLLPSSLEGIFVKVPGGRGKQMPKPIRDWCHSPWPAHLWCARDKTCPCPTYTTKQNHHRPGIWASGSSPICLKVPQWLRANLNHCFV